jgi:L-asparaginase
MKKVFILYTGGTIGMGLTDDSESKGLSPQSFNDLIKYAPALQKGGFFNQNDLTFTFETFDKPIDSSQLTVDLWQAIATRIKNAYEDHIGFVILHGTDTLAYTASMLSFMLEGLGKPVVLTGAQLPISNPRTDGLSNLMNSIFVAAASAFDHPVVPEVLICFNDDLLRGNRATKLSAYDLEGFASPNAFNIGELEADIRINEREVFRSEGPLNVKLEVEDRIINVGLFPGFKPELLCDLLDRTPVKGIILRSFGSGNVPQSDAFNRFLQKAQELGIVLLNITQCVEGSVQHGKYSSSANLEEYGVISGVDITPEAAITKLMWVLKNHKKEEIKSVLRLNLRGEITLP